MIPPLILLLSLSGMMLNLGLTGLIAQPDWSAALLLASLLAQRSNWVWVLPGFLVHDLVLHWSLFICLPIVLTLPLLLAQTDARLGAGLPQRLLFLILGLLPLIWANWSLSQWLMTVTLSIVAWYLIAGTYDKSA